MPKKGAKSAKGTKRPAKAPPGEAKANGAKRQKPANPGSAPTVKDIMNDRLTPLAKKYWGLGEKNLRPYDAKVIEQVYSAELSGTDLKAIAARAVLLEFSSYLENYLWKNFKPDKASFAHVMSIMMMVNEKFREGVPVWDIFHITGEDHIGAFFDRVFSLPSEKPDMSLIERTSLVLFMINCYASLEDPTIRSCCMKFISLPMWKHISQARLRENLEASPRLQAAWKAISKGSKGKKGKRTQRGKDDAQAEADFFPMLIKDFLGRLTKKSLQNLEQRYVERTMELLVDLLSRLPTRRFLRPVLLDCHFVVRCRLSETVKNEAKGRLLRQLLQMITFYEEFGIDDVEGKALDEREIEMRRAGRIERLQGLAFKYFQKELRSLVLASVSSMDTREGILKHLEKLSVARLRELCEKAHILGAKDDTSFMEVPETKAFLSEVFINSFEKRKSQRQEVSALPLYPSEDVLWDMNLVPELNYHGDEVLALPKLNLQFLTIYDYLLRNFNLFRLESTYEIREDIKNVVHRLKPRIAGNGDTVFTGWAKMAVPIKTFTITKVKKPNIGEIKPAQVAAEITVDLAPFQSRVRQDWEAIREHDVLFLLCVEAKYNLEEKVPKMKMSQRMNHVELGIKYVRGCEVKFVLDEEKSIIGERKKDGSVHEGVGDMRTYRVEMDTAQYQMDMTAVVEGADDVNQTFNLLVKRQAKENNFKAVLETIRNLMSGKFIIPEWLHDVFLGYGDPGSATYSKIPSPTWDLKFADSFLNFKHLQSCFPSQTLKLKGAKKSAMPGPPYKLTFLQQKADVAAKENAENAMEEEGANAKNKRGRKSKKNAAAKNGAEKKETIEVEPYTFEEPGPYPEDVPKRNDVRFTAKQVEAIRSGLNHGLTMIVGPPGTGKTDVAVQIMAELFHNEPKQRTLLVTHSNHALNDLFEKIMARDIDERYLLRCGRGEEELRTEKDFSKFGRVNYMLERRLTCLGEVARLAKSLGLPDDAAYTCETAAHFYLQYVLARWEVFMQQWNQFKKDGTKPPLPVSQWQLQQQQMEEEKKANEQNNIEEFDEDEEEKKKNDAKVAAASTPAVEDLSKKGFVEVFFPFNVFFSNAPNSVFTGNDNTDFEKAWGCWRHIKNLFKELEECRPFEILRNYKDRGNYLISKHAKVIAMTCTHAAIRRGEFVNLHLQYDNLIMEEAAQILEIETFIPMLLQEHDKEFGCRLKRVVLLGDHHQLPPIIKNMAFQKYSHMDQSLFARFIRLGTPHIQLDAQGRSRPSIAKLWNWRYKELGDLPHVKSLKHFKTANAGFSYEFQFINVGDYQGKGESSPMPYFYQNLAEAEYIVQVYMYMRLLGYPGQTISLLTTYNGQKALLEDIINQRCRNNPFYGPPARISTVDKYQGQQNDYVLLSLVRSRTAGHIRDVRRLVVAMSRARLGLYVFGRESLFKNCFELTPTFNVLLQRPTKLCLNVKELSSLTERKAKETGEVFEVKDMSHMGHIVGQMALRAQQNIAHRQWIEQQQAINEEKAKKDALIKLGLEKKKEFERMEREAEEAAKDEDEDDAEEGGDAADNGDEAAAETEEPSTAEAKQTETPAGASEMETEREKEEEDTKDKEASNEGMDVEETPDFSKMKYRELQAECKKRELPATGKKADLLERLQKHCGK